MDYKQNLIYLLILLSSILCLISCDSFSQEQNRPIICFTFDDGHLGAYEKGFPIFQKFGYPATTFINSGRVGKPGFVSWEQLHEEADNNWEIAGHTLNHAQLTELTDEEAYYQIHKDYNNFLDQGLIINSFALPSGHASERDYDILKGLYKNIRNSIDKEMHIPINRLDLGYLAYQTEDSPEVVKSRIIRGAINGEALIIVGFHKIGDQQADAIANCSTQNLEEILSWVNDQEFEVMRLDKAVEKLLNK